MTKLTKYNITASFSDKKEAEKFRGLFTKDMGATLGYTRDEYIVSIDFDDETLARGVRDTLIPLRELDIIEYDEVSGDDGSTYIINETLI